MHDAFDLCFMGQNNHLNSCINLNHSVRRWLFDEYQALPSDKNHHVKGNKEHRQDSYIECRYIEEKLPCRGTTEITCLEVSNDDTKLYYADKSGALYCYDFELNEVVWCKQVMFVTAMKCFPNSNILCVGYGNGNLSLFDAKTGEFTLLPYQGQLPISSICISPDESIIAIVQNRGLSGPSCKLTLLDYKNDKEIWSLQIPHNAKIGLSDTLLKLRNSDGYECVYKLLHTNDAVKVVKLQQYKYRNIYKGMILAMSSDGSCVVAQNYRAAEQPTVNLRFDIGRGITLTPRDFSILLDSAQINSSKSAFILWERTKLYLYNRKNLTETYIPASEGQWFDKQPMCLFSGGDSLVMGCTDGTITMFLVNNSNELSDEIQRLTVYQKLFLNYLHQRLVSKGKNKFSLIICPDYLRPKSRDTSQLTYNDYKAFQALPDLIKKIVSKYVYVVTDESSQVVTNPDKKSDESRVHKDKEEQKINIREGLALQKNEKIKKSLVPIIGQKNKLFQHIDSLLTLLFDIDKKISTHNYKVAYDAECLTSRARMWGILATPVISLASAARVFCKQYRSKGHVQAAINSLGIGLGSFCSGAIICWAMKFSCLWISKWQQRNKTKSLINEIQNPPALFAQMVQQIKQPIHKAIFKDVMENTIPHLENSVTRSLAAQYVKQLS